MCGDKTVQRLLVNFTATSRTIPGLKYLGVFLKLMVYGDVTIGIFSDSASTISLPVELKPRPFSSHKRKHFCHWSVVFFGASFSPLSTLVWTKMELPTRSKTLAKACVRCSLLSVTSARPLVIYSDMKSNFEQLCGGGADCNSFAAHSKCEIQSRVNFLTDTFWRELGSECFQLFCKTPNET